jgi:Uma2 family endonuclease
MTTTALSPELPAETAGDLPKGFELVDGELVEMPTMGFEASWVSGRLFTLLDTHCLARKFGVPVTAEASYQCFPKRPGLVRKPDVSVILTNPATFVPPKIHSVTAPGLVIEVASPGNEYTDLVEKVEEFLEAGTQLVWVVEPEIRLVFVHRADGTVTKLREPAELSGESVLPGFSVRLTDFLPPVPAK